LLAFYFLVLILTSMQISPERKVQRYGGKTRLEGRWEGDDGDKERRDDVRHQARGRGGVVIINNPWMGVGLTAGWLGLSTQEREQARMKDDVE
jgi:hypothetical protein